MKKLLPALCIPFLLLSSCKGDPEKTDSFVHSKIDSLVGVKMEEVNRRSIEDLEQRMTIEVKAKADSIVAARHAMMMRNDSVAASAAPMPPAPATNTPASRP